MQQYLIYVLLIQYNIHPEHPTMFTLFGHWCVAGCCKPILLGIHHLQNLLCSLHILLSSKMGPFGLHDALEILQAHVHGFADTYSSVSG